MRPLLVSQRLVVDAGTGEERDALDRRWAPFLEQAGFVPLLVPSASSHAWLEALARQAVGLVLSGGNDVSTVTSDPLSAQRDAMEGFLVETFERARKPVLGICRGLQLLAVTRAGLKLEKLEGHVRTRHVLQVPSESRWLAAFQGANVNSFHGYAPTGTVGHDWLVSRSADGALEALEHSTQRTLGIMWHPERETPFADADLSLFRSFFA